MIPKAQGKPDLWCGVLAVATGRRAILGYIYSLFIVLCTVWRQVVALYNGGVAPALTALGALEFGKEIDASQAERLGRSCFSLVPRSRSRARLRRKTTMSHDFSCVQPAFIDPLSFQFAGRGVRRGERAQARAAGGVQLPFDVPNSNVEEHPPKVTSLGASDCGSDRRNDKRMGENYYNRSSYHDTHIIAEN
ncbi:hypothetical protein EVAR_85542_1 [Eumeta japonica]|uniref:Uncharacterized protein n=1 Tax=Eumeta variegata TaxID=151549 RepID=A0A4C1VCD9_EUMVA|nr:hypothetical protein EVAR_85542_1 [Eumeta japonica]